MTKRASLQLAVALLILAGLVLFIQQQYLPLEPIWRRSPLLFFALTAPAWLIAVVAWYRVRCLVIPPSDQILFDRWWLLLLATLIIRLPIPSDWPPVVRLLVTVGVWGGVLVVVLAATVRRLARR